MKSVLLVPLLLLPLAASAAPEISVGAAGGVMITDPLEVIGSGWYVTPRVGVGIDDNLGIELDVGYQSGTTRIGDYAYSALTPRLNLVGKLWSRGKRNADGTYGKPPPIHPLLAVGLGGWYKNTKDDNALGVDYQRKDLDFLANAGPGLMVPLGPAHLRTDVRWVLSLGNENFQNRGDQFMSWEWTAGVGFTFGGEKDKDKDGIVDADDQCKDEAEDIDGFEDTDGCPEDDNDKDGVLDADDQCDDEPEDDDDFKDDDGCPDLDNDEDKVPDAEDECPNVAGMASAKGCPDQDEDSIVDEKDECPDEAGEANAFGCPDDDGDRVPNYRDDCPDEAGPEGANPRRSDGCPSMVFVTERAISIADKIYFDTGKATIKGESDKLLTAIADTLKKYPGIKKVSIEGHTDNQGNADQNKTLSEQRAAAVRTWLIEKGVEEGRLEAKGFGQEKPLVEGDEANTDAGRAKNRRVEFNITEQEEPKREFKRPVVKFGKIGEGKGDLKGLVAKNMPVPEAGFVTNDTTCILKVVISEEGKITKVQPTECIGMARVAAAKAAMQWEFEPYEVDGAAKRISTQFEVKFEGGETTIKHQAKNLKTLE